MAIVLVMVADDISKNFGLLRKRLKNAALLTDGIGIIVLVQRRSTIYYLIPALYCTLTNCSILFLLLPKHSMLFHTILSCLNGLISNHLTRYSLHHTSPNDSATDQLTSLCRRLLMAT